MALTILYQDETLVAVDKPAGMLVHPGREPEPPECIAMKVLRDQLQRYIVPVHRLDRPTSGVLLFAFDKETSSLVQQAFASREVSKTYLAVVPGEVPPEWQCREPLQKSPEEPVLDALTLFRRIAFREAGSFSQEQFLELSLVEAVPHTGRFHQIRRHLLMAGFPIAGDYRYAGRERSGEIGEILGTGTRMLLQARKLQLKHPHSGGDLVIQAPVDPDIRRCFPGLEQDGL